MQHSVFVWNLLAFSDLEVIVRYFPELTILFKLIPNRRESIETVNEVLIELDFDGTAGDLQVFELTAHKNYVRLITRARMLRRKASNDAIGCHHVEDVQALDGCRHQGCMGSVFVIQTSRNMGVGGRERNELLESKVVYARIAVASYGWEGAGGLHLNETFNGPNEMPA
jgi:hypothetical protein